MLPSHIAGTQFSCFFLFPSSNGNFNPITVSTFYLLKVGLRSIFWSYCCILETIFSLQKYFICKESYIIEEEKSTFIAISNFPSCLTWMKFGFSRCCTKLWEWFLAFPIPVPNYGNGFLFLSFPSQKTRKVFLVFPFPSWNSKSDSHSCLTALHCTVVHTDVQYSQSVANIRIFEYICEYSLQIILLFLFAVKKIVNNICIGIRSRVGWWIFFVFVSMPETKIFASLQIHQL